MIDEMIVDQQQLTAAIHADLLGAFYDLSQTDTKIQMLLIPIMVHLRRMEKAEAKK